MYLTLKLLHVVAVIIFLGNITTGLFWHAHAARTRDPKLLAHTMDGIIRSDRWFTLPGVVAIIVAGVALAVVRALPAAAHAMDLLDTRAVRDLGHRVRNTRRADAARAQGDGRERHARRVRLRDAITPSHFGGKCGARSHCSRRSPDSALMVFKPA